ncbi:NAD(P)/FAD-dependent oxidoreductase [Nodosilinea sp. E11]|uniref:NAD(P)/FAD-dependent oxidoreductase n=1 Tax=Nodosilinea sp. E11 TaxID=3037479 RepID=UPI002934E626|nr:FAD-dependent oxidoreductase [Nodosilinea sp. E11]WOD41122.1 FAD-dependent oxidoreductase [Nodosilinea sp. E11]
MDDVVVIGAGLSGLTAARQLHQAGYRVLVVDKSRGLGGRMATRRLGATVIDHGCRYLQPFADASHSLVSTLLAAGVLQGWQPESFALAANGTLSAIATEPLYIAPHGMSAVAKALAPGLTIHRHWRATTVTPISQGWRIEGEIGEANSQSQPQTLEAKAVVVAIPAPQAAALIDQAAADNPALQTLNQRLQAVQFEAVLTVMAGYGKTSSSRLPAQQTDSGWMITGDHHPQLRWIALDSSKHTDSTEPVVVVHSSAAFAAQHLDHTDLASVGQALLTTAAQHLAPWLASPEWTQVHRWRYGFVHQPLGSTVLSCPTLPHLVGCGDWCNGGNVEGAIASGHQAANLIAQALAS